MRILKDLVSLPIAVFCMMAGQSYALNLSPMYPHNPCGWIGMYDRLTVIAYHGVCDRLTVIAYRKGEAFGS
jgi:hypothetical protein